MNKPDDADHASDKKHAKAQAKQAKKEAKAQQKALAAAQTDAQTDAQKSATAPAASQPADGMTPAERSAAAAETQVRLTRMRTLIGFLTMLATLVALWFTIPRGCLGS